MKLNFIRSSVVPLAFLILSLASPAALGGVPPLLNFQGRIVVSGAAYSGAGQFQFALVDGTGATTYWSNDGTSSGGSEPSSSAIALTLTNGLYAVLLGDTTVSGMTQPLNASLFTNADVRLRVWFNDGTHGFEQLSPDQRIAPAGYALVADTANNFAGTVSSAQLPGNLATTNFVLSLIPTVTNGLNGATGPQGPAGPQGPQGATGPQGIQGIAGTNGTNGVNGVNGTNGLAATVVVTNTITGAAGTSAVITNLGTASAAVFQFTVPQGATGATGPQGPTGPQGVTGPQGPQGIQGIQGIQGVAGANGTNGPSGVNGTNGLNGAAATIVVTNTITGAAGTSALVTNLGTASAAVFRFTVPQGATGAQGPQGATGATGPQGPTGPQGATGPQGPQGIQGIQGIQGVAGANGTTGPSGVNGTNGLDGAAATIVVANTITGAAGTSALVTNLGTASAANFQFTIPQGATGAQGPQGATGATGPQGPTGPQGATGPQGPQGVQGVAGVNGINGTNLLNAVTNLVGTSAASPSISGNTGFVPTNYDANGAAATAYKAATNFVVTQGYVKTVWNGTSGGNISANTTDYLTPNNTATPGNGNNSYVSGFTAVPVTQGVTLTNLYVVVGLGNFATKMIYSATFTILTNGVASPIAVTISGMATNQAARTFSDTTHSVTVSGGTEIGVVLAVAPNPGSGTNTVAAPYSWSFQGR